MMDAPSYPFAIEWSSGYIGFVIATFLYGVEVCQFVFYLRAFRSDTVVMKLQVYIVAILDTIHFSALVASFYRVLISCRMNVSLCSDYVPASGILAILLVYCITFIVQSFYAHRVWIISSGNRTITLVVLALSGLQLAFGLVTIGEIVQTPTYAVLVSTKYTPMSSIASAICDAVITLSVMYYLRPTTIRRKENVIKKLLVVFVEMGLFTFINALIMAVLYYIQDHTLGRFLTSGPGVVLSKSYVNSMFAVLNVRKPIRDGQESARAHSVELPTIPTVH